MQKLNEYTFLALIFNADPQEEGSFQTHYGIKGCQDLRRNALYSWIKEAIIYNKKADLDFLEIMVSVVLQLQDDGLIEKQ